MALDYAKLPNDPEELKQLLLQHSSWADALREEVIRLRRWRFGRSSEVVDLAVLAELPLSGGVAAPSPASEVAKDSPPPPPARLISVEDPARKKGTRRPPRVLPPELPRVIRVHHPPRCDCPDCGQQLTRLGEDTSEQLDYVPGYFQVIRHVRPKLTCSTCARIMQAAARVGRSNAGCRLRASWRR